jgi:HK97 family phage portal protein
MSRKSRLRAKKPQGNAVPMATGGGIGGTPNVLWPSGNGDRGPPGSWQMNLREQSPLTLLAFSAVYGCVTMISGDISKLPIIINKIDTTTGAAETQRGDYYAQLFREPNDYQTYTDFMQLFILSFLLQGNAYAYCGQRNMRGEVTAMHVLDPRTTFPYIGEDGSIFYRCGFNRLAGLVGDEIIPERDIVHHRLPLLPAYPLVGVTPIFAAAASTSVGISILANSQKFFSNASRPSGVLKAPGKVSEPTMTRLQQDWDNNYSGERFGKTAVLPEGLSWESLTITAQDAQLIEQLRWSVEDVGRVFRVPPFLLGDTNRVTYRNSEALARAYLSGCLAYHIEALQRRWERAFQFPINFQIRYDLSQFLTSEIDVRYLAYQQALNSGWMSINEVRGKEGMAPVAGGEEPRVQMQYVPLSAALEPPPAPAPPAPTPPEVDPPPSNPGASFDIERVRGLVRHRLWGTPSWPT